MTDYEIFEITKEKDKTGYNYPKKHIVDSISATGIKCESLGFVLYYNSGEVGSEDEIVYVVPDGCGVSIK